MLEGLRCDKGHPFIFFIKDHLIQKNLFFIFDSLIKPRLQTASIDFIILLNLLFNYFWVARSLPKVKSHFFWSSLRSGNIISNWFIFCFFCFKLQNQLFFSNKISRRINPSYLYLFLYKFFLHNFLHIFIH